ncbi:MAG: beta-N-acetylhexosaminidase [Bacteroidales bacterium]|nr:beta-N-acetylhexosaminidase [Bacteroidales bacterium]
MKTFFTALFLCLDVICSFSFANNFSSENRSSSVKSNQTQSPDISIVPKPKNFVIDNFLVSIENPVKVFIDNSFNSVDRDYLFSILKQSGINAVSSNKKESSLVVSQSDLDNSEGYILEVLKQQPLKIKIAAKSKNGVIYAFQTLKQIVSNNNGTIKLPACYISDEPEFAWRAFMLDESRHFQGMQTVKNLLDEMAALKMNLFHWHLVDDPGWRIEIKKYPLLTSKGSKRDFSHSDYSIERWDSLHSEPWFYTQEQIKEIVGYADKRGITIVPEIEVPGHASASIYAYPWLGATSRKDMNPVWGDLYQVADPKVMQFLQDVMDEVIALFPSKIVHIGGDEANYAHWRDSKEVLDFMKDNNIPTCSDMQLWAINKMSAYLDSKGCKMIGWNEITGDNIRNEAHVEGSKSQSLAKGTLVQFWDGEITLVNKAIERGFQVVNSNRFFTYLDYPYEAIPLDKAYSFNPYPDGLSDNDNKMIVGSGCQMWGEFTPNLQRLYFQIFPRIGAYAECGWANPSEKDYNDFCKRMIPVESKWKEKGFFVGQPSFSNLK